MSEFRSDLQRLVQEIEMAYEQMQEFGVTPSLDEAEIDRLVGETYPLDKPRPLSEILRGSAEILRGGLTHVAHPRYYGFFNPSVSIASVCADALAAVYNPQLAVCAHAPAAVRIERRILDFIAETMGFAPGSTPASHFTTGGTEANHTSVLAALNHRFNDYARVGLVGLGVRPTVYISEQGHESFDKIAQMAGLSSGAIRRVPTDDSRGLDLMALQESVEHDRREGFTPLMVVATAGSTTLGVIDPLPGTADLAQRQGLWFHVDAAWGGAAAMSPRLRPLLRGIERADSVTIDAHKWFSVAMGAGMFFCRHADALRRAFGISTSYMPDSAGALLEPYATTMQWSRRFIGLKLAMTLAEIGAEGMAVRIEHQADMGDRLRRRLAERGFDIEFSSALPLVCFSHPTIVSLGDRGEEVCRAVAERVQMAGHWIASVRVRGRPVLRACVTSYRTQPRDIDALVDAVDREMRGLVG